MTNDSCLIKQVKVKLKVKVKVKVNFTLEMATKAQRFGRGIALPFS